MKGILFKPDMIQAIREGRKTVTRRVIMPQPKKCTVEIVQSADPLYWQSRWPVDMRALYPTSKPTTMLGDIHRPRYRVGEVVYIKEAWRIINPIGKYIHNPYDFGIEYLSVNHEVKWWTDNGNIMNYPIDERKRSPMFLPEKYARAFVQITDVRPERLQEITEDDAIKEGFRTSPGISSGGSVGLMSAMACFREAWNKINPKTPWESNPWVWRIEFKKVNP